MKKLIRIVVVIVIISVALIVLAVMNSVSDENLLEDLKSAPVSTLSPAGELAEIFAFGTDYTDIQRENKLKEIRGSVVAWQLPVYEVKRDGMDYKVQTQNPVTFGNDAAIVPTIITLTAISPEDKAHIESLKTGDIISFKGTIHDVKLRHLIIKPAYIYEVSANSAATQEKVATDIVDHDPATDATESEINASLDESTDEWVKVEDTHPDLKVSFDCSKAATTVEQMVCNDSYLGKLDGALADNYKIMMAADIGDGARDDLKSTQQQWLANRNNCTDGQCLMALYQARIDEVCEQPVISGVHPICVMSDEIISP